MQKSLNKEKLRALSYAVGSEEILLNMPNVPAAARFDERVIGFLDRVSKKILENRAARQFPDVVTFAFWIRRGHLLELKKDYPDAKGYTVQGRGMAFHIAPSNVPVNYAYSLVTGLLSGNANVVKIPSKSFEQVELINQAFRICLEENSDMKPYIVLVRYGHEQEVNDALSEYADVRIIWGGDRTIREIRKSPLHARAVEVAFADRYSLAVIDSDIYLKTADKKKTAVDFYNDTYLTDQNACTSPRAVIWTGTQIKEAKEQFWAELHELVKERYELQPVQAVNKLTSSYLLAACYEGQVCREKAADNLIVRLSLDWLDDSVMEWKDNSGYFFEYDCERLEDLKAVCDNTHCQTIAYIGDKEMFGALLAMGLKGVDRIVPVGQTMDFAFVWDGYDLMRQLTRTIRIK